MDEDLGSKGNVGGGGQGMNAGLIVLLVVVGMLVTFLVGNYALYVYAQRTLPPKKKKPVSKKKLKRERLKQAGAIRSAFAPFVDIVKTLNLPDWLVHWGHPGNMAVVLFAMGGYGTYLGFRIRFSDNPEEKAKAKSLHPKLLAAMFFFFALGATGGVTSLLTSDKPILESPHAVAGITGLSLLTIQTLLPTLFEILEIILINMIVLDVFDYHKDANEISHDYLLSTHKTWVIRRQ